jgi:hypothetical protein
MKLRRERGDVPVGCLVGVAVFFVAILIGIKVTPVMIHVGELDKEITNLADRAGRRDYNDKRIIRDILRKAEEVDLPVTKESIKIDRGRTHFKIWVTYQKDIDFVFYTYHWNKEHYEDRPIF